MCINFFIKKGGEIEKVDEEDVEDEHGLDNIESSSVRSYSELKGRSHAERELELDAGGDIDTGDVGNARGDLDTRDVGDAGEVDPDTKVDVFRVGKAEHQYFVNEIDLIHYNFEHELKDGIEALLLQENARLHGTYNTPLIAKFTFMYSVVNGDEWIELSIDEVDFVQHVYHIYAFDVLLEIDDVDVQVFKIDDFNGGIDHFLGPV
ncbi:unnamed protein product [Prunus armeniaca]|uniref:Uncharacterized protein n=1 Tax=Prunus armeniaca TaxID=36596 RepID=A0A6J5XI98_PRUAR|nr:hypothetical protein GBA52_020520 [Prunus armeniaca]CAB4313520.1 unnamed protein product [Prunus armeniaca]